VVGEHRTLMVVFAGALVVGLVCAMLLPVAQRSGSIRSRSNAET
jgi:type II secretory pathway component PulF